MNSGKKICPGCEKEKAIDDFGRNVKLADGIAFYCKECFRDVRRASYRRRRLAQGKTVGEREAERCLRGPRPDGHKWCSDCGSYRPLDDFPRNRATRDGHASYCKTHQNARSYKSRQEVHGGSRHYHLVRRYGITAVEVEAMISGQSGVCLICLRDLAGNAHVDHDHVTGEVRGVLCFSCNGGLGQFRDDKNLLLRAVQYLDGTLAS